MSATAPSGRLRSYAVTLPVLVHEGKSKGSEKQQVLHIPDGLILNGREDRIRCTELLLKYVYKSTFPTEGLWRNGYIRQ